jgi:putative transposase
LGKSTITIKRIIDKVKQVGVATLAVGSKDQGQYRISKEWHDFTVSLHHWRNREGYRINHNQISGYLKALASQREKLRDKKHDEKFKGYSEVREDLIVGKHPSHVTVYKVINSYLEAKYNKVRHPGSPIEAQILQTTEGRYFRNHLQQPDLANRPY